MIFEQGGTLSQFTGDGMMVFFDDGVLQRPHPVVVVSLGDAVATEPAGEVALKGMTRPVSIHRVMALR